MFQALAGSCAGHDCTEGNICKGKTSDGQFECTFKCKYFIFYILRFYFFKYVQPLSFSVFPQYKHDRNACTFQISVNQHLCLE